MKTMIQIGESAREASYFLANADSAAKNDVLIALAEELDAQRSQILDANGQDVAEAVRVLTPAMVDRLTLNDSRIDGIISDVRKVASLPDPVGECFDEMDHVAGLKIHKVRTPLGVVAVIYESRPNVTIDSACLLLKSGNASILRGGKETMRTNTVLMEAVKSALRKCTFPEDCVQAILSAERALVSELLQMDQYIDMLIPRGGAGLHDFCRKNSHIPVITGGIGVCHIFVDKTADLERCIPVIRNAKVQRPTVCNALETLLVHRDVADSFLPQLCAELAEDGVSFRADERASAILARAALPGVVYEAAGETDFDREWLCLTLSVAVVDDVDAAISHIQKHSTGHSESILTQDQQNAAKFTARVNSAAVYVNCSTRFTDGSELGLGAEIAISTQPLHARGPMALRELTTYKWVINGDYDWRK